MEMRRIRFSSKAFKVFSVGRTEHKIESLKSKN